MGEIGDFVSAATLLLVSSIINSNMKWLRASHSAKLLSSFALLWRANMPVPPTWIPRRHRETNKVHAVSSNSRTGGVAGSRTLKFKAVFRECYTL